MKLSLPKSWYKKRIKDEEGLDINAGSLAPSVDSVAEPCPQCKKPVVGIVLEDGSKMWGEELQSLFLVYPGKDGNYGWSYMSLPLDTLPFTQHICTLKPAS
jgi:hypothetical protein